VRWTLSPENAAVVAERPDSTEEDCEDRDRIPALAPTQDGSLTLIFDSGKPCAVPPIALGNIDGITIGRAADARAARPQLGLQRQLTLQLGDRRMSLVHAHLRRIGTAWTLEDAGSKNGTRVNGLDVARATLRSGDLIELGRSFLVYRDDRPHPGVARDVPAGLRTANPRLARQFEKLTALARSSIPIVVSGETGTGKELIASAVHELSGRSGPLRAVNCGALPRSLLESELFGYRKGAFSGATEDRPGLIRAADKGTLFLDEIADLPFDGQAALLRVLQEAEVLPIGGVKPIPIDVRIIVATHRDLAEMVERDTFRADLLARLSGFTVVLPPLRERREDLGALVRRLFERHAPERASSVELSAAAVRALHAHAWPANIRELEKVIATALILSAGGIIELEHFPGPLGEPAPAGAASGNGDRDARSELAELGDRERLALLLARHGGNVSLVAAALKTSRTQVHRLCRRFGIDVTAHRPKR
jgi:sigma-54 dependent transcriptional regulator, acetoin dehydrogenase operon transcriptional activator AcoR